MTPCLSYYSSTHTAYSRRHETPNFVLPMERFKKNHTERNLHTPIAKIRNYRDTYRRNRHVAFLPVCMSTSGRIHGELLRLIFFISNKQAEDYFETFGYQPHSQEFCHRRGVFFQQNRGTIGMACAQAVALRGAHIHGFA